jgi:hypothetical protein
MSEFAEDDVAAPDVLDRSGGSGGPRHGRRLSDKILVAFHHACDAQDLMVAEQLLKTLESMLTRRGVPPEQNRRRALESLVAAHERLWHLRHKEK